MEFCAIFKDLRVENNYNQNDVAEKIGVTRSTISDWETKRSEPNVLQLTKVADLFNCSIDYLVGREDDFGVIQVNGQQHLTTLQQELLHYFDKMSDSQKNRLIGYAFAMVN